MTVSRTPPAVATPAVETSGVEKPAVENPTVADLRALAHRAGLQRIGIRPPLGRYLRELWQRREFIKILATSKAYAANQTNYLGQFWSILTPLLNAVVYVVIFGIVLGTRRGLENVIGFIVVGTFMFRFFSQSAISGGRSVQARSGLTRALRFPRAVLPISTVMSELVALGPALAVMFVIVPLSGLIPGMEPVRPTLWWLLTPLVVALLWAFNTGCAFVTARLVAITPDLGNVVPVLTRFVMYGSGVLFSIERYVHDPTWGALMAHQPVAVYLYLARACVLQESSIPMDPTMWLWGVLWAVLFFWGGLIYFWRGEVRYGRD